MKKISIIPLNSRFSWICPAKPYYLGLMAYWAVQGTYERYGLGWPKSWIFFENNKKNYFYGYLNDVHKNGLKTIELLYSKKGRFKSMKKEYQKLVKCLDEEADKITPDLLEKFTISQLVSCYKSYLDLFKEFWFRAIFAELSGYGVEEYLKRNIKKGSVKNVDESIDILLTPNDYSFFQKEQIDLIKLLNRAKVTAKYRKFKDWQQYLNTHVNLKKQLDKHSEKYNWINNSYESCEPQSRLYFYKKAWELLSHHSRLDVCLRKIKSDYINNETKRRKVLSRIHDRDIKIIGSKAGEYVAWHDDKKGRQLKFQRAFHYFLKEFSIRFGLNFDDILNCLPFEIDNIIKTGKLPARELNLRKKIFLLLADIDKVDVITGKEVVRAFKLYQTPMINNIRDIKGITVSNKRILRGVVRIINNSNDMRKMKKNEVLVAEMTSPEYISVIRKAKAVITDHGGMTCHAAIVSRELKIPCIVGTSIATKILKDGDRVEVDANQGTIKILNK